MRIDLQQAGKKEELMMNRKIIVIYRIHKDTGSSKNLYCIVVTSSHCVLHRRLAIKGFIVEVECRTEEGRGRSRLCPLLTPPVAVIDSVTSIINDNI